jgi:TonB family protein
VTRRRPFRLRLVLITAGLAPLLLTVAANAHAQPAAATPSSPSAASLVLLASRPGADLTGALKEALTRPDPGVRAVAARLVGALRLFGLSSDLAQALIEETNPQVSGEQVRSLLLLEDPAAVATVESYVPHASVPGALAYARWLARVHPERMLDVVPTLADAMGHQAYRLLPVLLAITRQAPELAPRLFAQYVHDITAPAARSALWNPIVLSYAYDPAFFHAALTSDREPVREAAVWRLVDWLADGAQPDDDVVATALSGPGLVTVGTLTWEQYGREIIARETRGTVAPDRSAWLKTAAAAHPDEARLLGRLPATTDAERDALRSALGSTFRTSPPVPRTPMTPSAPPAQPSVRTLPALWPGLVTSVFEAAGCRTTGRHRYEAVTVSYRADGRLDSLATANDDTGACTTAAAALVRLVLADPHVPVAPGVPQTVLVPIQKDVVACLDQPDVDVPAPRDVTVRPVDSSPTMKRPVRPDYTNEARDKGVQGDVWLDVMIGRTGCVQQASITRTLDAGLDLKALDAAMHWRFNPLVIDGRPREVRAIMVLEFRLRK